MSELQPGDKNSCLENDADAQFSEKSHSLPTFSSDNIFQSIMKNLTSRKSRKYQRYDETQRILTAQRISQRQGSKICKIVKILKPIPNEIASTVPQPPKWHLSVFQLFFNSHLFVGKISCATNNSRTTRPMMLFYRYKFTQLVYSFCRPDGLRSIR